jgi:hypothetical protein
MTPKEKKQQQRSEDDTAEQNSASTRTDHVLEELAFLLAKILPHRHGQVERTVSSQ